MTIEYAALISGISIAFAIYFGISNTNRNKKIDTKNDTAEMTTVIVKLENISSSLSEFKGEMNHFRQDNQENRERLIKVEESSKQAHKRIDEMIGKRKVGGVHEEKI